MIAFPMILHFPQRATVVACALLFTTLSALSASADSTAGELKAGAAQIDITPPPATPMVAFYGLRARPEDTLRLSSGVMKPIFVKAVVVEKEGVKMGFVALDLLYTSRSLVVAARSLIEEATGIPGNRVMVSAIHTHAGPLIPRDSLVDEVVGANTEQTQHYTRILLDKIKRCVIQADARLEPVEMQVLSTEIHGVNHNRRFRMEDGSVSWRPRKPTRGIVGPAGPVDPELSFVLFQSSIEPARPIASIANFGMHPTSVAGVEISPDYPGFLAGKLESYFGDGFVSLFANGCCGNVGPRNQAWLQQKSGRPEADRLGSMLAAAIFQELPNLQEANHPEPLVASVQVALSRRVYEPADIESAERLMRETPAGKRTTSAMVRAARLLDNVAHGDTKIIAEVQAMALTQDVVVIALPGEIFVELGLDIKRRSPFKHTIITTLANGSVGYLPNQYAFPEGKYEVDVTRCAKGSGEMLVEAALQLTRELAAKSHAKRMTAVDRYSVHRAASEGKRLFSRQSR